MSNLQWMAKRLLASAWDDAVASLDALAFQAQPSDGERVFEFDESESTSAELAFGVGPVVFFVPERAAQVPNMYVVMRGRITLNSDRVREKELHTAGFATEVAYFRHARSGLQHVYGAHFDYSPGELGHPVFHVQMKGYQERAEYIKQHFELPVKVDKDGMQYVIRTLRMPSAQMDVFSFLTQLAADHLIDTKAPPEAVRAFNDLRKTLRRIRGIGDLLAPIEASQCMRGDHWYRDIESSYQGR